MLHPHETERATGPTSSGERVDFDEPLRQVFDVFWDDLPDKFKNPQYMEAQDYKNRLFDREVVFINMVYSAVSQLADRWDGPITVLYDLDETLVASKWTEEAGEKIRTQYVRPGFTTLTQILEERFGGRISSGILTSRGQEYLDGEMGTDEQLKVIQERISSDFMFSSSNGGLMTNNEEFNEIPIMQEDDESDLALNAVKNILNPEVADAIRADDHDKIIEIVRSGRWYDPKLAIAQYVAKMNPKRGFVIVDDFPFPNSIDKNHPRLQGVSVRDAIFHL